MSLWADYVKELRGEHAPQFIEFDWGFISYTFPEKHANCINIEDIYVIPSERKSGKGTELLDMVRAIGLKAGKKYVTCQLELHTKVYQVSLKAQMAAGFIPIAAENGKIYSMREV